MTQWAIEDGNISEASGTATNILSGLAKAWNKFDMVVPEIDDSFNISGITDNGTGDFSEDFTNGFVSSDYLHIGEAAYTSPTNAIQVYQMKDGADNFSTGSFRGEGVFTTSTVNRTNFDFDKVSSLFHGDLA